VMVAFIHPNNIVFTRWFDQKTGELLQTQTESGGLIREEGEIKVNGIRFPKKIVTTINGKSSSITFTKIQVNQSFPESLFEVPMPQP
jgi:outer membrane lipoprotein-sorting protein